DGREVVTAAKDAAGKSRIVLAALDRQSPPHQIPHVEGDSPLFGKDGEVCFRDFDSLARDEKSGAATYLTCVRPDGTNLRRVSDTPILLPAGISRDGEWVM